MRMSDELKTRGSRIRLLITDVDGVLTDNGVYYSAAGEELKRFSFRDGMGVERLRDLAGIETGIITRENSPVVAKRAEKLRIREIHMNVMDKMARLSEVAEKLGFQYEEIAYIGDDVNDVMVMKNVGLSACPVDAMTDARDVSHYVCEVGGGQGAFREFAEFILYCKRTPKLIKL